MYMHEVNHLGCLLHIIVIHVHVCRATHTGSPSPLDPHDSYFRVRLVCILLDTCGHYFDHGSTKKKLDAFLIFFQCYLFTKRQPLPLEVDHMVQDTLEGLRPGLELFKSQLEAVEAAMELEKKYKDKIGEMTARKCLHHCSSLFTHTLTNTELRRDF